MANIEDLKITSAKTNGKRVADLSASPSEHGMSAQELQAHFDALSDVVIEEFNKLLELLAGTKGAENIGAKIEGIVGETVQEIMNAINIAKFEKKEAKLQAKTANVTEV